MALPGEYDLHLYRGDSAVWQFRLWADDAHTVPVDLTGATVKAEIRDKSAGPLVTELVVSVAMPNTVDMELTPELWVTIPAAGVWDLQLTLADGTVQTPVAGKVTATPDVTDSVAAPVRRGAGQ